MLGPGVEPCEVGGPCTRALATLKLLSIPLVSLDIPSGMPGMGGCPGYGGRGGGPLCSGSCPGLPALDLSFPIMDGLCTLGVAEGTSIPQMGKTRAIAQVTLCPLLPTPSPVCPLPTLAQLPGQT